MSQATSHVLDAIEDIRAGRIVIVVDDDDRENEGDLIVAAAKATPEQVAFVIRYSSGILCAPLLADDARRLRLDPMVAINDAPLGTAFTVSIDYRHGLTTGISAEERCNTVRALANPNAGAADFVRPGHVFPLIAKAGGVLMRSGHTEAAVDLARLAGLPPVGLIGELMNDDGTVMRGPQIAAFASGHGLRVLTLADLIAFRQSRERLVERVAEFPVHTANGDAHGIAYTTPYDDVQHLALVFGKLGEGDPIPTRFHRENLLDDVFGRRQVLTQAMEKFREAGRGVLIYLREGVTGVPVGDMAETHRHDDNSEAARRRQWREIGLGAQILRDLGVDNIRLLATRSRQYVGLTGFGISIAEVEIIGE
ncbi:MAG: 3,4-dihydroxy-2-butanone-4-phosphate synthase [Alphaproteobacteria bacterium]|nr:3,4-dihydroxy-2-butanone-4-phosphate synthase [Alphaproteobacteria bacterium]